MGKVGRAGRWAGRQARTFVEPITTPFRFLYAYIAARIGTWILGLVLMITYCVVAGAVAVVVYLFLYHNFVPVIAFHKPLYFDFVREEPWAVADFADKWSVSGQSHATNKPLVVAAPILSPGHIYDFSVDLDLPDSPTNDEIGMFMVTLSLYSWNGDLLANSSRPCRIRYKTDLLQKMSTLFWSLPLVLGLVEEKQSLHMELMTGYVDTRVSPFGYATVSLSRRELQLYSADLHIEARLSGISYFCYYWFFTAMAVFVPLIFLAETWLIILTWLVIFFLLPTAGPVSANNGIIDNIPLSPRMRRRRAESTGDQPGEAVAPLAGLEELGHEARSPSLPRAPHRGLIISGEEEIDAEKRGTLQSAEDEKTRAKEAARRRLLSREESEDAYEEEEEEEERALQELLEQEIARKLAAGKRREEETAMSASEEEDTGAGVYPRLRRRRPPTTMRREEQDDDSTEDENGGEGEEEEKAGEGERPVATPAEGAEVDDKPKLE